jgi:hypothetical protein
MKPKLPKLPKLLNTKIYKTGQSRGADDDVIFQNRVGRNSTVLIPYQYTTPIIYPEGQSSFENGFIVLISPSIYFNDKDIKNSLKKRNLILGTNCLVFYETRQDWDNYNPNKLKWEPAQSRKPPLEGSYVARIPATTATTGGEKVIRGFSTSKNKGAGIRLYEYASKQTVNKVRLQLEAVYWLAFNSIEIAAQNGMNIKDAEARQKNVIEECEKTDLLDYKLLRKVRVVDKENQASCPLCREKLSAAGFFTRLTQAEGRDVPDLTVTEINIFHIDELRYGIFNHKPYNLGWGHHHCNVVVRDIGISRTLEWMQRVLDRNKEC